MPPKHAMYQFRLHSLPHVMSRGPARARGTPQTNADLHLVHTLRGRGILHIAGESWETTPAVVLALPMHVRCEWSKPDGRVWQMQNIHYAMSLDDGVPLSSRYALPVSFRPRGLAATLRRLRRACRQWQDGDATHRMTAAAELSSIIAGYWRDHAKPALAQTAHDVVIERLCTLLNDHAADPFDAGLFASQVGLSVSQMNRRFRAATGHSPQTYWQQRRLALCKRTLTSTDATLESLAPRLGFSDVYYFCRWFRQQAGVTPGQFRRERRPAAEAAATLLDFLSGLLSTEIR